MVNTPSQKTAVIKKIIQGIQGDITLYDELHELLIAQQHGYLSFDGVALQTTTTQLQPLLDTLHNHAYQRTQLLNSLGLPENRCGMQRLMNALPTKLKQHVTHHWHTLEARIYSCQQQNQRNGELSASVHELLQTILHNTENDYSTAKLMHL